MYAVHRSTYGIFFRMAAMLVSGLLATVEGRAQQLPQYTQYVLNNYLLNPAVSGIENYTDIKSGYRSQWTGLPGAPVSSFATINFPIGTDFIQGDAASFSAAGENPMSRSFMQNYSAAPPHHGAGLMILSDKAGLITQTSISASYAYHLGLSPTMNLAMGVSAGTSHISLNISEITIENPADASVNNIAGSRWSPELGLGIWLYASAYYLGASAQQLLPKRFGFSKQHTAAGQIITVPHYFFTGGFKAFLSEDLVLMPSFMLKFIQPVPVTFDVNLKLAFKDKFWIGGSYRRNDSFAGLIGVNINSFINIGYSYDVTSSNLNTVSNGSHEIVIGLLLNNKYKVSCPTHTF